MDMKKAGITDERKTAPVYIVREGEILIDAPIRDVWPHVVNYPSWQNYSIVQHVSGPPGQEGEVILLKKEEGKTPTTPYYARTIKLDPERRVIWKTYRENVNSFGIVEFKVDPVEGKTRFSHSILYEHLVAYEDESELDAFRNQQYEYFELLTATVFPRLKVLAEKGRAAAQ